jgi:formylmethanofuran dehydrogenase subunit E
LRRVRCAHCGEYVQDCRDVERNGEVLCKACAGSRYYEVVSATPV